MRLFRLVILLVALNASEAQTQIPPEVMNDVAKDLATLQAEVLKAGEVMRGSQAGYLEAIKVTKPSEARAGADRNTTVIFKVREGTTLPVLDKANDWYAVKDPSNKVGWVHASAATPVGAPEPPEGTQQKVFRSLVEGAAKMREQYKNNPYVIVKGFSVNISIAPSVELQFEFK